MYGFMVSCLDTDDTKYLSEVRKLKKKISLYKPQPEYRDDKWCKIAVEEAANAAEKGNFGVGAVLVNMKTGKVVTKGQNKVFAPMFRSDLHAEMDALNKAEKEGLINAENSRDMTVFTSLESCPMCTSRQISAGVGAVKHVADDPTGGMVHIIENLPPIWVELSKQQKFEKAEVSPTLKLLSEQIFAITMKRQNDQIIERGNIKPEDVEKANAIKNKLKTRQYY